MTDTKRWNRVRELFDEAIDLASDERKSYLQEQCAGDLELLSEVSKLISADQAPHSMLGSPALATFDPFTNDNIVGEKIGALPSESRYRSTGSFGKHPVAGKVQGSTTLPVHV